MLNFFYFLRRNASVGLFLLLSGISFAWMINERSLTAGKWNRFRLETGSYLSSRFHLIRDYFHLKERNRLLQQENARLYNLQHTMLSPSPFSIPGTHYIPAKIINRKIRSGYDFLIIDKGEKHGIVPQSGVYGADGVTGVVARTSKHFSKIITLYHPEFSVDVKLKKSGIEGFTKPDPAYYPYLLIEDLPYETSVVKGDTLVTGGSSLIFPPGIAVATVVNIRTDSINKTRYIIAEPTVDYRRIHNVYVSVSPLKPEMDSLLHD